MSTGFFAQFFAAEVGEDDFRMGLVHSFQVLLAEMCGTSNPRLRNWALNQTSHLEASSITRVFIIDAKV